MSQAQHQLAASGRFDYSRLGADLYTCVAPPGYEKDPAVSAAINEFDPTAIPMWRVRRWRMPGGEEINVVHHMIGRYYPWPRYLRKRDPNVMMPMDARHPQPNFLDKVFEDDDCLTYKRGGPGGYIPWDWETYAWCRFQYDKSTLEAWLRRAEAKQRREARERASMAEELEYRKKQIEPFLMKKAGEITDSEWEQYLEAVWGKNRGKVQLRRSKAFSDLGRSPRAEQPARVAPAKGVA